MSEKLTFKVLYLLVAVLIAACDGNKSTGESPNDGVDTSRRDDNPAPTAENALKTYANERFKNVTVHAVRPAAR